MCGELHPRLGVKPNLGLDQLGNRYVPHFCFPVVRLPIIKSPVLTVDDIPFAPSFGQIQVHFVQHRENVDHWALNQHPTLRM